MPLGLGGVCVLAHERIALVAVVRDLQSTLIRRIEGDPVKARPVQTPAGGAAVDSSGGRGTRPWLRPMRKSGVETDLSAIGLDETALALCGESVGRRDERRTPEGSGAVDAQ